MPGGNFFNMLEKTVQKHNAHVTSFRWSGKNTHEARQQAAQSLVKLIQTYDLSTDICLIGHSHGGNVCTLATQLLGQDITNKHRINTIFALGTPTHKKLYPDMNVVNYFYNLFSFEDLIQPVCALFEREYQKHERIANIRVFLNDKEPDHALLHHPLVAQWIPCIHQQFTEFIQSHNTTHDISHAGIIYLYNNKHPIYKIDDKRKELLERDLRLSFMLLHTLQTSLERKHIIIS